MKKIALSLIMIGLVATVITLLVYRTTPQADIAPQRTSRIIPVVVEKVSPESFADRIEALGTTLARESVVITADVTGRVVSINFDDGERIQKGAALVALDNDEERASVTAAQANYTTQKTQYERLQDLVRQKSAAQVTLDEQANAMKRAAADLEIARVRLQDRTIQAPFSGQLGIRRVSPGALVTPGDEIVTLDDLSVIKLDFSVPETILSTLQKGLNIEAKSVAFPERPFSGKVKTIDTRIDPVTRTVVVRAELPNHDGILKPGMLLTVTLLSNHSTSLRISEQSLIPVNDRQFVYRVKEDGRVERVEVTIGRRQPGAVEILEGLNAGDLVVTEGTTRIDTNSQVEIVNRPDTSQVSVSDIAPD